MTEGNDNGRIDGTGADQGSGVPLERRTMLGLGLAVAAVGTLAAPQVARAQTASGSRLYTIKDRGKLIVGTGSTNPPWHFQDASGALAGMDIDLSKLLAKGLFDDPEAVEFVIQGSDARIPSLITDKVDIVVQWMTITPGRAQQVDFTVPYYREGVGLMVLKDGARFSDYASMKAAGSDIKIGGMQNVFLEDWVHAALPDASVDAYDSPDASIQALNAKRVDATLSDQSQIRWMLQQNPGRFADAGYGWLPNSYASAVKPGDQTWLNWVNSAYREAMLGVDFDTFAASYEKWFGIKLPTPNVGFPQEFA